MMLGYRRNRRYIEITSAFIGGALVYSILFVNKQSPSSDEMITGGMDGRFLNTKESPFLVKPPPPLWQKFLCGLRNISLENMPPFALPLEMINSEFAIKPSQDNIFLMESGCNPLPSYRVWCSVESWAKQNPRGHIWYIMTSPYVGDPTGLVNKILTTHTNLKIVALNFEQIFKKTPLREFFSSMKWTKDTEWPVVHLSDMARVALVWSYGGHYSDTDVISIASAYGLYDVLGGFEGGMEYANGQFHCRPHHTFLHEVMKDMAVNFDPKSWGSLGPVTFTRVVKKLCGSRRTTPKDKTFLSCVNMTLLPPVYFIPVHYGSIEKVLLPGSGKDFKTTFKNAYSIHFFSHLTAEKAVSVGNESVYDVAAKQYCPITYKFLSAHSLFF